MDRYEIRETAPGSWMTWYVVDTETQEIVAWCLSHFEARNVIARLTA